MHNTEDKTKLFSTVVPLTALILAFSDLICVQTISLTLGLLALKKLTCCFWLAQTHAMRLLFSMRESEKGRLNAVNTVSGVVGQCQTSKVVIKKACSLILAPLIQLASQ